MYRQLASVALMGLDNALSGNEKDMSELIVFKCYSLYLTQTVFLLAAIM